MVCNDANDHIPALYIIVAWYIIKTHTDSSYSYTAYGLAFANVDHFTNEQVFALSNKSISVSIFTNYLSNIYFRYSILNRSLIRLAPSPFPLSLPSLHARFWLRIRYHDLPRVA